MDLQVRKIQFVQEFLKINNEQLVDVLEKVLKSEKKKIKERYFEAITIAELNQMIDQAEDDIANNRMISLDELKTKIESWK